jgi:hypothetical protein
MIQRMIENLAAQPQILRRFNEVDSTVLMDRGVIERLLKWPEIRKIEVVLERPNPSDFDDDQSFYERLRRRGLKKEITTYIKAPEEQTIVPDVEMKKVFAIAANNGKYVQRGINPEGVLKTVSSTAYPMQETIAYDPDVRSERDAFLEVARELAG